MGNIWRILSDVTYPIVAYTTVRVHVRPVPHFGLTFSLFQGHEFNRSIYKVTIHHRRLSELLDSPFQFKAFYDAHIEDMWLPYFCNSTNILTSRNEIHSSGYAWRYIRKVPAIGFRELDLTVISQAHQ